MSKSSSVIPVDQLEQFIREFFFLNREMSALRHHYVITEMPEKLVSIREHLKRFFFKGGSSKRVENIDLFYNFCLALSGSQSSLTMGELSQALQVPLSTATRIVDWLVEGDYAKRLTDPQDRRVVRVTLTDTGREIYRILNEFTTRRAARVLRQFTDEERAQLINLLHRLARIMSEEKRKSLDIAHGDLQ